MTTWRIETGDCRDVLRSLPAASVHTVVTSPPYFGLRDYGTGEWEGGDPACDHSRAVTHTTPPILVRRSCPCGAIQRDQQIGLEPTPGDYVRELVDVFREVWRVLRDDGTVWLNLGDSYVSHKPGDAAVLSQSDGFGSYGAAFDGARQATDLRSRGYKSKDLLGIPWMVAFALRQPWYAGTITSELDRVWLAAMIDAEGCVYIHRRREGQNNGQGYVRKADSFGSGLEVANTSLRVVERCQEITGRGSISRQDKDRRQPLYRWCLRTNECRDVLREVYPYLVAKQHEARLACGVPSSGERATAAWQALKLLHGGGLTDVDFPAPASLHEPGWYLRMDNIWSKLNPMPESVTDRPTRAHEYVFLLSKSPRYFYDADAIREPHLTADDARNRPDYEPDRGRAVPMPDGDVQRIGTNGASTWPAAGRNKRSVWTVATQPYAGAHFATFPPKLIEPCILAGAPERCCAACGAPWVRVVGRPCPECGELVPTHAKDCAGCGFRNVEWREGRTVNGAEHRVDPTGSTAGRHAPRRPGGFVSRAVDGGFEPTCDHDGETTSGLVLDPFAGAGTAGLEAVRLGRRFVGVELNAEYAAMARQRIETAERLGFRSPSTGPAVGDDQASLFDLGAGS